MATNDMHPSLSGVDLASPPAASGHAKFAMAVRSEIKKSGVANGEHVIFGRTPNENGTSRSIEWVSARIPEDLASTGSISSLTGASPAATRALHVRVIRHNPDTLTHIFIMRTPDVCAGGRMQ